MHDVWDEVRDWLAINRVISTIHSGLKWMKKDVTGTSWLSRARRIAFTCTVYTIWLSRNSIFKAQEVVTVSQIVSTIQTYVYQALFAKFPVFERLFVQLCVSGP